MLAGDDDDEMIEKDYECWSECLQEAKLHPRLRSFWHLRITNCGRDPDHPETPVAIPIGCFHDD